MALVLSLETSTDVCSVALHNNKTLLKEAELHQAQAHASKLALLIDDVITGSGVSFNDINAVAISSGPGSYTGLRIGTSTAKGICYALSIPLIAVSTLQVMAYQASSYIKDQGLLCPMIDARRMEVYCQVFEKQSLRHITAIEAKVIDEQAFHELLTAVKVFFFGNGASKCKDAIKSSNACFLEKQVAPLASALGDIAAQRFSNNQVENLVTFEPFYLKEFIAKKAKSPLA